MASLVALPFTTRAAGSPALLPMTDAELPPRHHHHSARLNSSATATASCSGSVSTSAPCSSSSSYSCCGDLRHSFGTASHRKPAPGRVRAGRRTPVCYASSSSSSSSGSRELESADPDWYQVLGVGRTATPKEVKAAYRQLALKLHPDVVASEQEKQECTSRFVQVQRAYAVLSDPQAKAAFDLHQSMSRFQTSGYAHAWRKFTGLSVSDDFAVSGSSGGSGCSGYAASASASPSVSPPASSSSASSSGGGASSYGSTYYGSHLGYAYGCYGHSGYSSAYASSSSAGQGFTSYASASYPSVTTPSSQWKGRSWETDQCW